MRLCLMGLVIGCLGVVGCGPDIQAICEARIACTGGNDLDVAACVATTEVEADYQDDIGCGDEYDAYYVCIEPHMKCNEEQTGQPCAADADCGGFGLRCSGGQCVAKTFGVDPDDADVCEAESAAYSRCD